MKFQRRNRSLYTRIFDVPSNIMAKRKSKNPAKTKSKKAAAGRKGGKKGGRRASGKRRVGETTASFVKGWEEG